MKKILILTPSFKILGGVANHYQGLMPHWKIDVRYLYYGKRKRIPAIFTLMPDFIIFMFKMMFYNYDAVIVNPSLRAYQLGRDALYLYMARLFKKKVVTFIHGWDYKLADDITNKPNLFCKIYGKSSFIYVLYSEFKKKLDALPLNVPVLLTTTKVKDELLEGFDVHQRTGKINNILFLARADKFKGLDIAIKTFEILKRNYPNLHLFVCGTGNALEEAKEYVRSHHIADVSFKGHVSGNDVANMFINSDLYILPTHGEGMATSVLEAMAFGLPIITRPVGGVNDFFKDGEMGYLLKSLSPVEYANKIQFLIDNTATVKRMSIINHDYAKLHFLASKVAEKIEEDLMKYL